MTPDDLVERVARLYEDKWGVSDHTFASAAIRAMIGRRKSEM